MEGGYSPRPPCPRLPHGPPPPWLLVLRHIMVNLALINALRSQKG